MAKTRPLCFIFRFQLIQFFKKLMSPMNLGLKCVELPTAPHYTPHAGFQCSIVSLAGAKDSGLRDLESGFGYILSTADWTCWLLSLFVVTRSFLNVGESCNRVGTAYAKLKQVRAQRQPEDNKPVGAKRHQHSDNPEDDFDVVHRVLSMLENFLASDAD
jgi:hypothetical protein